MTPAPGSLQLPFQALTGAGIRVAVVDSGVDPAHPRIRVAGGVAMSVGGDGRIEQTGEIADTAGHGTACAGIILKKAPAASIYSVRIFDESLSADGSVLVAALRWCLDEEMDVVNLSLGTTDPGFRRPLAEAAPGGCPRRSHPGGRRAQRGGSRATRPCCPTSSGWPGARSPAATGFTTGRASRSSASPAATSSGCAGCSRAR